MNVGLVGCGVISRAYVSNSEAFDSYKVVACADVDAAAAASLAAANGCVAVSVDNLIDDPEIDIVLNLTPPGAHEAVISRALAAGKHVYSEKPLATSVEAAGALITDAGRRGLRVGCAPDIFLGGAYQAARALLDEGAIGKPLAVSAAMLCGGQTTWHPNPDIFYADGAGPLLDMGPYYLTAIAALVGPVRRVSGFASTNTVEQTIEIGPRAGERFVAQTPTHTAAVLELEGGLTANFVASFDAPTQYVCDLVIHGSDGDLALPDPNSFGGIVRLRRRSKDWQAVAYAGRGDQDVRGLGLHDLVQAIAAERPHRASGDLALHVVDVARAILASAAEARVIDLDSGVDRPEAMPVELAA